jgi:hypothetical protein
MPRIGATAVGPSLGPYARALTATKEGKYLRALTATANVSTFPRADCCRQLTYARALTAASNVSASTLRPRARSF